MHRTAIIAAMALACLSPETLPLEIDGRVRACCVLVAPSVAVSVEHVARSDVGPIAGVPDERRYSADGEPAALSAIDGRVSVWSVCGEDEPSQLATREPAPGSTVEHRYCKRKTGDLYTRRVIWVSPTDVRGRFVRGMSGSGVYDSSGLLIGLVDQGNHEMATVVPYHEIRKALERAAVTPKRR